MEGANDPNCRRPVAWVESLWNYDVRGAVTRLIRLRRSHPCLRRGGVTAAFGNGRVYAYYRDYEEKRALVGLNNTTVDRHLELPAGFSNGTRLVDALGIEAFEVRGGVISFPVLRAHSVRPA